MDLFKRDVFFQTVSDYKKYFNQQIFKKNSLEISNSTIIKVERKKIKNAIKEIKAFQNILEQPYDINNTLELLWFLHNRIDEINENIEYVDFEKIDFDPENQLNSENDNEKVIKSILTKRNYFIELLKDKELKLNEILNYLKEDNFYYIDTNNNNYFNNNGEELFDYIYYNYIKNCKSKEAELSFYYRKMEKDNFFTFNQTQFKNWYRVKYKDEKEYKFRGLSDVSNQSRVNNYQIAKNVCKKT